MNRFRMIFGAILVVGGLLAIFAGPNRQDYQGWETIIYLAICALVSLVGLAIYQASARQILIYLGLSKKPSKGRLQAKAPLPDGRR